MAGDDEMHEQRATPRLAASVAVGVSVALCCAAIGFLVVAIPLLTLASFEPNGLSRPFIRTGLFVVAAPVGALIGLAAGIGAGWFHRSGRRWSVETGRDRFSTR